MPNTVSKKRSFDGRNDNSKQGSHSEHMKKFAETLIGIIKQADANGWHKGWKSHGFRGLPKNYRGNNYSGGNSMFLLLMSRLKGYKTPVFLTFRQANQLDSTVKKGEHGIPVFKWGFLCRDKNGKKYEEEQVDAMSKEEKDAKGISKHPFVRTYTVYNIDQTNFPEVHKDRYQALLDKYFVDGGFDNQQDTEGMYKDEAVDRMVSDNQWVCPIKPDETEDAYYSSGRDVVVVPMKSRFRTGETKEDIYTDGMEYYSTMFHEMAHSTGHESRLNRQFADFGSHVYAREELVAESTAALLAMTMGYNGKVLKNSGDYLANWQSVLNSKPEDIIKVMSDVSKASDMIIEQIDKQRVALNQAPIKAENPEGLNNDLAEGLNVKESKEDIQSELNTPNKKTPSSYQEEQIPISEIGDAVAYGTISKLEYIQMSPLEGMKARYDDYCSQHEIDSQKEESAVAFLDYVRYNNLSAKWWPESVQADGVAENVSPSEDSNPQTDLAGVAERIMETNHVSMREAEKMAAPIVDAQQSAANEKKQKAEQAKQEAVKKADEARKAEEERRREVEEQRRREEENSRHDKDGGQAAKIVLHAALLLGALEMAKGNKGIWMNKSGKSNAEFLGDKRPIMAYNNIMMNLQSDQKGYRSNVYTSYDSAKNDGISVKQDESSLAFNWTKWDYQNIATKEIISREAYANLPAEEKETYVKHSTREAHDIFNIDQTIMPSIKHAEYSALLKEKGAKCEELSDRGVSSMTSFSEKLKANHPTAIVVARTEDKYEIYGKDAARAGKILNLPVSQTEIDGKSVKTTGFPLDRIDDYLPKLVQARQWVVVADSLDSAALVRRLPNEQEVLNKAYSTTRTVAQSAGMGYERVMVLQDAEYDRKADKIIVSGMADKDSGNRRQAAIEKANDIYRALVAATGSEQRLDRMGRNNLLPKDDAKYERLVQELSAGVLMTRQGLPATLSKDSMQHIDYWQRELRENPKLLALLEKDVNNAVESIDKHMQQQVVKYEEIRKDLPPKDLAASPRQFQISTDLAKLPDMESKEIVIVRDKAKGTADVILPEGASLEDDVEISGIRKDRIRIALGHEGITNVRFYNAGGLLGLKEPNDYYKDKAVSVGRLKQYEFNRHRDIDVQPQIAATANPRINVFTHIRDEKGQYAFFFKAENEPSFSVYPNDAHKKLYFDVRGTEKQEEIHHALAQKYYSVAKTHPEIKVDLVMPKVPDVDVSKIERPTITRDKDNPNKKYVMATINGEFMKKEISKSQWDRMWLADDMSAYKKAVAAVVFEPVLKESAQKSQSAGQHTGQPAQQADSAKTGQTSVKDAPTDGKDESEGVGQDTEAAVEEDTEKREESVMRSKGMHA